VARQLTLPVSLPDTASFDNFYSDGNDELVNALRRFAATVGNAPSVMHVFGPPGCGKTHLMYAGIRLARESGQTVHYLPMREQEVDVSVLEQVNGVGLVCVDDIDVIAGTRDAERALFQLYERVQDSAGRLVTTAYQAAHHLGVGLPDLVSRLRSGETYRITPLTDAQKRNALRLRAAGRGMTLSDEVADYVLRRYPRDTHALFGLLDRIDEASLSAQRRITIPFLQELDRH
jgi:DnaA family protein